MMVRVFDDQKGSGRGQASGLSVSVSASSASRRSARGVGGDKTRCGALGLSRLVRWWFSWL